MRQQGFSLLEILVAFSILALSLGVLMQIFSGTTRNADLARDQTRATALAQSLLASTHVEPILTASENGGTTDDGLRWRIEVAPFEDADEPGAPPPAMPMPTTLDLWLIKARVAWGGGLGSQERSVNLTTLRTRPRLAP
jgi:general secretion pathway protein I